MKLPGYYSRTEIETGLAFCAQHEREPHWRNPCRLFRIVIGTGLKISQVLNLKLPTSIRDNQIFVNDHGKEKGVPIPRDLIPYLKAWLQEYNLKAGYLFRNKEGQPADRFMLYYWWECFLREAGLRYLPIEKARRSNS